MSTEAHGRNHAMIWAGRGLKDHWIPIPLARAGNKTLLVKKLTLSNERREPAGPAVGNIRRSPQVSTSSWDHPYSVVKQMDLWETTLTSCPLLPSTSHLLKVVGHAPQGHHQHHLPDTGRQKDSTSGNKVAIKTSADHVPAETLFPQSPGKIRVEMIEEWQRTNSWSKLHFCFIG